MKSGRVAPICASALVLIGVGCATARQGGPPSLALSGRATWTHYLAALPASLKLRHQVATRFGDRTDVVEGYCVVARPGRFWVRATAPMGGTLFDIKSTDGTNLELTSAIPAIANSQSPFYMARDIRRIYLLDCPPSADLEPVRDGFRVSCRLDTASARDGAERPDDALAETVSPGGIVWAKELYRDGVLTAVVRYDDYRQLDGLWLAHRITLEGRDAPYSLTIALVSADLAFDPAPLFAPLPTPTP